MQVELFQTNVLERHDKLKVTSQANAGSVFPYHVL